jgi:hypothetical protein
MASTPALIPRRRALMVLLTIHVRRRHNSTGTLLLQLRNPLSQLTQLAVHLRRRAADKEKAHRQKRKECRTPPTRVWRANRRKQSDERDEGAKSRRYPVSDCPFDGVAHNPCSARTWLPQTGDFPRALNASGSEATPPNFKLIQRSEGGENPPSSKALWRTGACCVIRNS